MSLASKRKCYLLRRRLLSSPSTLSAHPVFLRTKRRDVRVRFIHQRRDVHQIVVADALTVLPVAVVVPIGANNGDVVHRPVGSFVLPDCGLDAAMADRMNRLVRTDLGLLLL